MKVKDKNGRFITKKNLGRKNKCRERKIKRLLNRKILAEKIALKLSTHPCQGRRLVEIPELAKNLTCCNCQKPLHLENIEEERKAGLLSYLKVRCTSCKILTNVPTGKVHDVNENCKINNRTHNDMTTDVTLGK